MPFGAGVEVGCEDINPMLFLAATTMEQSIEEEGEVPSPLQM